MNTKCLCLHIDCGKVFCSHAASVAWELQFPTSEQASLNFKNHFCSVQVEDRLTTLRNDVQEFHTQWDEILLFMTKIPTDDVLEGVYKLRIRQHCIRSVRHGNSSKDIGALIIKS